MKKLASLVLVVLFVLVSVGALCAQALTLKLTADPDWGDKDLKSSAGFSALVPVIGFHAAQLAARKCNRYESQIRFKEGKKDSTSPWSTWTHQKILTICEQNKWYTIQGSWAVYDWDLDGWHVEHHKTNIREFKQIYGSGNPWFTIDKDEAY